MTPSRSQERRRYLIGAALLAVLVLEIGAGVSLLGANTLSFDPALRDRARVAAVAPHDSEERRTFRYHATSPTTPTYCTWSQSSAPGPHGDKDVAATATAASSSCATVALVLFGVPKEFARIWHNYVKHVVTANPELRFEVHMHMYADLTRFSNAKNAEWNATLQSPWDIQRILGDQSGGVPVRLIVSSQRDYDAASLAWLEERDTKPFKGMTLDTLKNVFRQGNSIRQAYASASTRSPRDNATAAPRAGKTYLFLRSDTLLISPIEIPCRGIPANELHLPSWHVQGAIPPQYNDRTALAGAAAAATYARAKAAPFRDLILDRREENGGRVDSRRLHNSERMLKLYLDGKADGGGDGEGGPLRVVERGPLWAQLLRVRAGGVVEMRDWKTFPFTRYTVI